jgi:hypothetical protein
MENRKKGHFRVATSAGSQSRGNPSRCCIARAKETQPGPNVFGRVFLANALRSNARLPALTLPPMRTRASGHPRGAQAAALRGPSRINPADRPAVRVHCLLQSLLPAGLHRVAKVGSANLRFSVGVSGMFEGGEESVRGTRGLIVPRGEPAGLKKRGQGYPPLWLRFLSQSIA